jgi:NADPH:quinone reductase-like Zn-dependent oxidoreductase
VAVQLAKRMGARVFAVASGADGVALVERLGADWAVDGRGYDVAAAVRAFAPDGVDAALMNAGGEAAEAALEGVRAGGRIAYPHGVEPEPRPRAGARVSGYDGEPDREVLERLGRLVEAGPFEVHVGGEYPLEQAAEAQAAVERHHLGKIVLRVGRGG